ncbi:YjgP/YjgQ family permease [Alloprevotella sp. OH1205_COT-284]|uniref:LptF/LptG family permease n=1 Tax=Alloprevotella sp. OH1205_COT-284 TaxID=2491043 RepID=UPI000F5EC6F2|nr:LptF/LptG family permease [Alloprevotella sp. OH1205_COT-284]RRD79863.1 YjgP/YjgQ family permease [Alloprevotella sp. OH1205_COT-284]
MLIVKRLDTFILGKFLQLFVGAFFICLFVFMMQFTWRWINDLVGKGLTPDILAQFFWHMGITLVPMSLPLAVLLASLITFGNMGENLELLSMKAAGVPLVRVMLPILWIVVPLVAVSFHFQNSIAPNAHRALRTLATSIKISQPALQIPEGVFYGGVENLNLFVERKNAETGMLYRTIIYKTDQGFDRAQIVLADSARLELTADKLHLRLTLWSGEQFQNLKSDNMSVFNSQSVPYDRETFSYKQLLIDFDSNFNQLEADQLRSMPQAKNMRQIVHDIDSMNRAIDSSALDFHKSLVDRSTWDGQSLSKKDSMAVLKKFKARPITFDRILKRFSAEQRKQAEAQAASRLQMQSAEYDWRSESIKEQEYQIRRHQIEWHQKLTLSLACLLFFFVGAPLGAIIRKGGLGMPTVISVGIFILYYIINTSGMKTARDGTINMTLGMWISTAVLTPAGAYLTFMANRDSVVFNLDAYKAFFRKVLGLRTKRHLHRKEVIITPPDYENDLQHLHTLIRQAEAYTKENRLWLAPNYFRIFFRTRPDEQVEQLSENLENLVEDLANTADFHVLQTLNELPLIHVHSHTTPFSRKRYNWTFGLLFPLGVLLWLRIWRFRLRLLKDLRQIVKSGERLEQQIRQQIQPHTSAVSD